jgi:hypothetical protein
MGYNVFNFGGLSVRQRSFQRSLPTSMGDMQSTAIARFLSTHELRCVMFSASVHARSVAKVRVAGSTRRMANTGLLGPIRVCRETITARHSRRTQYRVSLNLGRCDKSASTPKHRIRHHPMPARRYK